MPSVSLSGEPFTVAEGYDNFWRKATAGRWEPATFEVIRRAVDADTVVFDIGAWIGPTVLYEARRARRVEAFEPDPASAAMLRQNLAFNPEEAAKVRLHECAVWTEEGPRAMGNPHALGDSTSSLLTAGAAHGFTAECIAASELVALVGPDEKLFIKMDVEGAEYAVLPALAPLLERDRVAVLVAFHPQLAVPHRPRFAETRRLTREVFAPFDGFEVARVSRRRIGPSPGAQLARATGLWLFEAKDNYLFHKGI